MKRKENVMTTIISPKHTQEQFKDGMTQDDKLDVFIESVRGWQIVPAKEMLEKGPVYWDFATLRVVLSYFEMIAKYRDGYVNDRGGQSPCYFKEGLKQVFPNIESWPEDAKTTLLDFVYEKGRCGLYHTAMTLSDILISRDFDFPLALAQVEYTHDDGTRETRHQVHINVRLLVAAIESHFAKLEIELRDKNNSAIRDNFEKRFDFDRKT